MESRTTDLETVSRLRSARIAVVEQSRRGNLDALFQLDADSLESQAYVVKLLDVHPRLGKVAGRRLMAEIGIAPLARIADLTPHQVALLQTSIGDGA
jgi:hypothetical protein